MMHLPGSKVISGWEVSRAKWRRSPTKRCGSTPYSVANWRSRQGIALPQPQPRQRRDSRVAASGENPSSTSSKVVRRFSIGRCGMGARGACSMPRRNTASSSSLSLPSTAFTAAGEPMTFFAAQVLVNGRRRKLAGSHRPHGKVRAGHGVAARKDARQVRRQRLRVGGNAPFGEGELCAVKRLQVHALPDGGNDAGGLHLELRAGDGQRAGAATGIGRSQFHSLAGEDELPVLALQPHRGR